MASFYVNKPPWKHVFSNTSLCILFFITDHLNKVRTKLNNVIKSFEMTLNSKHRAKKKQRKRNMKSQNTQKRKLSFIKRVDRKCRLI